MNLPFTFHADAGLVRDADRNFVCDGLRDLGPEIVKRINAHDKLLAACEAGRNTVRWVRDNRHEGHTKREAADALLLIDAAIAKAKGTPETA